MSPEECAPVTNQEGFLVDPCTGEVIEEGAPIVINENSYADFSTLEFVERTKRNVQRKERATTRTTATKDIVLRYVLSKLSSEEKELFYIILDKFEKYEAAMVLAIYEFILERMGRRVDREYQEFLKQRGIGVYAIRQRKKLLRSMRLEREIILLHFDKEKREEAAKIYQLLNKFDRRFRDLRTKEKVEVIKRYLENPMLRDSLIKQRIPHAFTLYPSLRTSSPSSVSSFLRILTAFS